MSIVTDDILEAKEVADKLRVSERTVMRLVDNGELAAFKVGDRWRFRAIDVDRFIEDQIKQRQQKRRKSEDEK